MIPNKRGQALIEFVLILPVFIMLIFGVVDFGRIIVTKNNMINITSTAVDLYKSNKTNDEILKVLKEEDKISKLEIYEEDSLIHIELTKEVNLITPGVNLILKNPYKITTTRVIPNE